MSNSVQHHRRQPTRLPRPWGSPGKNTRVGCHFLLQCRKVKSESEVAQLCPTLSDPMDCSLPGSSVRGIFQARALEWGAIAFSNLSSDKLKLQIKNTMRYHLTPVQKTKHNKCWQECREKWTLVHCWWECKLMQPLYLKVWRWLRKLKLELLYDSEIPFLGVYLKKTKH